VSDLIYVELEELGSMLLKGEVRVRSSYACDLEKSYTIICQLLNKYLSSIREIWGNLYLF
jgi:hypothetical protein